MPIRVSSNGSLIDFQPFPSEVRTPAEWGAWHRAARREREHLQPDVSKWARAQRAEPAEPALWAQSAVGSGGWRNYTWCPLFERPELVELIDWEREANESFPLHGPLVGALFREFIVAGDEWRAHPSLLACSYQRLKCEKTRQHRVPWPSAERPGPHVLRGNAHRVADGAERREARVRQTYSDRQAKAAALLRRLLASALSPVRRLLAFGPDEPLLLRDSALGREYTAWALARKKKSFDRRYELGSLVGDLTAPGTRWKIRHCTAKLPTLPSRLLAPPGALFSPVDAADKWVLVGIRRAAARAGSLSVGSIAYRKVVRRARQRQLQRKEFGLTDDRDSLPVDPDYGCPLPRGHRRPLRYIFTEEEVAAHASRTRKAADKAAHERRALDLFPAVAHESSKYYERSALALFPASARLLKRSPAEDVPRPVRDLPAPRLPASTARGAYRAHVDSDGLTQGLPGHHSSGRFALRNPDGSHSTAGPALTVDALVRLGLRSPEYLVCLPTPAATGNSGTPGTHPGGLPRESKAPQVEYEWEL